MKPINQRIKTLQQRIADWPADALLVTNPPDIRYLTGFAGEDSWALVRARAKKVHVLSDHRYQEDIADDAPQVTAIMRKKTLADEVGKLADRLKLDTLAIQADYCTLAQRKRLAKAVGARRLKDVDDGLIHQRAVKTPDEVKAIRKAIAIQQQAYENMLAFIEPGQTEYEVAAYLEYQMRALGADGRSFATIVAADANASKPHATPGKKKIRKGGIVLIDWGAKWGGYCGDLTRVIGVGGMNKKMREVYSIVLDAQMAAVDAIAPGKALADIDKVARDIIKKAGYGKRFAHGLGHGIGLDIHEQPVLSYRSEDVLKPGQVVTVEPGIYLPGVGGVRIEDDVLVTDSGRRILSSLPKDLKSAII